MSSANGNDGSSASNTTGAAGAEQQGKLLEALGTLLSSDKFIDTISSAVAKKNASQASSSGQRDPLQSSSGSDSGSTKSGPHLSLPLSATQQSSSAANAQSALLLPVPLGTVSGHDASTKLLPTTSTDDKDQLLSSEGLDAEYSDISDSGESEEHPRKKKRKRSAKKKLAWKVPAFADTNDCQWKAGLESINRMRYVALARLTSQLHNFRVSHMGTVSGSGAMTDYNTIQEGIELEMNYIRLADSDPEGWGLIREMQRGGPNINNRKLLQLAARAAKNLKKKRGDGKSQSKRPFPEKSGGYGASRKRRSQQQHHHSEASNSQNSPKKRGACYTCGDETHYSRNCPQNKARREKGPSA